MEETVKAPIQDKTLVPTENLKKLHDNLSKREGFNIPLEQFEKDMQDESNLKRLHDNLAKQQDFTVPYDQFKTDMFQPEANATPAEQPLTYMQKELRQKFPENYTEEPKAERETSYIPEVTSEGKQLLGSIPATRPDLSVKHPEYFAPKISDSYQSEKATTILQGMGDKFKPIDQEQLESEIGGAQIKQDRPLSKVEQLKVDYIQKTKGSQEAIKFKDGIINGKGSFGGEIVDQLQSGGESLLAATYGTPGYLYDILGSGYRALGMDVPLWKDSWAKEEKIAGVDINPLSFLEKQKNDLLKMAVANDKEVRKANPDIDKSIIELFQKGDTESINAGLRNIFSSIAQSAPASIAMMTTGGMSTVSQIGLGAAVFGSQNMNEADKTGDYGGVSRDALLAINGITGSFESAFETIFGAGAVGRGIVGMIKSKGKDIAGQEIKEGIMESFSRMVIENPWLAPFGESFEEMGTQLSQNIVNKYSGYKPDIKITDGVVDSGIVGFVMGTGMSGGISLAKKAMNAQPVTTATIDGQQFTINNPEDLGIEGKPIFAKDAEGNVIPVKNHKVENPITQTQGEINQAQQAAADQQALMNGITDPNAQIVDEVNEDGIRLVKFSNGQSKIITPEGEHIANNQNEEDIILEKIVNGEPLEQKPVESSTEPSVNTQPKYPLDKDGNPDVDQMDEVQMFNYNTETFGIETAIADLQGDIQLYTDKITKAEKKLTTADTKTKIKTRIEIQKLNEQKTKLEQLIPQVAQNINNSEQQAENVTEITDQNTVDQFDALFETENNQQINELQNEDSEKVIQPTAGIVAKEGENTPQENQGERVQEGLEENVNQNIQAENPVVVESFTPGDSAPLIDEISNQLQNVTSSVIEPLTEEQKPEPISLTEGDKVIFTDKYGNTKDAVFTGMVGEKAGITISGTTTNMNVNPERLSKNEQETKELPDNSVSELSKDVTNSEVPDVSYMDDAVIGELKEGITKGMLDNVAKMLIKDRNGKQPLRPIAKYFVIQRLNNSPIGIQSNEYPTADQLKEDYNSLKRIKDETEIIEREVEAITREREIIELEAENVTNSQQAGELGEKIQEVIDRIDDKLAQIQLNLKAYSTENIDHEQPNIEVAKLIKKDIQKYSKALAKVLGFEHDTIKNKPDYGHSNIAPAGGDAGFILWMPNSEYGVYVSISYQPDYKRSYDDYKAEPNFLWRLTTKKSKYSGMSNQYAKTSLNVGEFAELVKKAISKYQTVPSELKQIADNSDGRINLITIAPVVSTPKAEVKPILEVLAYGKKEHKEAKAEAPQPKYGDKQAEYDRLRAEMRKELGTLNSGPNPKILEIGIKMGLIKVEFGTKRFAAFAKEMIEDIGEVIKPFLKIIYNGVRDYPGMEQHETEMDDYMFVKSANIDELLQPTEQINVKQDKTESNDQEGLRPDNSGTLQRNETGVSETDNEGQSDGLQTDGGSQSRDGDKPSQELQGENQPEYDRDQRTGEGVSGTGRGTANGNTGRNVNSGSGQNTQNDRVTTRNAGNLTITPGEVLAPRGDNAKIKANIEAIKVAKKLFEKGQKASPAQMNILKKLNKN